MTVLVLDNPELMAKAAVLETGLGGLISKAGDDSLRKPHRMRFHYGFNQHRLSEEDQQILRQHAAYLKAHPELTVEIHGHTDAFGNEEYNAFLARLRASSAAKLLQAEGIREGRITVTGWGSRKPLARPEDHAANRRLELEYRSEQMAKAQ
ncbi:MAG: OmpA family protein [Marinobacter sp.]|uniref:OmpA family protein n=1 Tax=Marinobacter sp. TaxID=50741 RepID=UPI00299D83AE|nr:OmpA family protein [Marinobacter sp.]MDX1634806.1 OmpA family protein [Marinobacter sp.]